MPNPTDPTKELPSADAQKNARFSGGLEPGSLRGRVVLTPFVEDEGEAIIESVTAMSGDQMQKWMKIKGNSDKLAAAYVKRRK
jgi:hypothetical protein